MYSARSRYRKVKWVERPKQVPTWGAAIAMTLLIILIMLLLIGLEISQEDSYLLNIRKQERICETRYLSEGHSITQYGKCQ